MFAEEQLKARETKLLIEKYRLESTHTDDIPLKARYNNAITKLESEKAKLNSELEKVNACLNVLIISSNYTFNAIGKKEKRFKKKKKI